MRHFYLEDFAVDFTFAFRQQPRVPELFEQMHASAAEMILRKQLASAACNPDAKASVAACFIPRNFRQWRGDTA